MAAEKMEAKQYDAAVKLFKEFLAKYPLDARDPAILYYFARMNVGPGEVGRGDCRVAAAGVEVSAAPDWAWLAQYMIAETLEKRLGKLEEALEAYRKVTCGTPAPAGPGGHRPADGQENDASPPSGSSAATRRPRSSSVTRNIESGDGPRVQGRSGDLLPQDAPGRGRRGAGHRADRPGPDVRVQGARSTRSTRNWRARSRCRCPRLAARPA